MKKLSRIALILLLMAGTLVTLRFMQLDREKKLFVPRTDTRAASPSVESSAYPTRSSELALSEQDFSLAVGETYAVDVTYADGAPANGVQWFSSDEAVAAVDGGKVTAVGAGEAEITAQYASDKKVSLVVSVYEDWQTAAAEAVVALAVKGCVEDYNRMVELCDEFRKAKDAAAREGGELIGAVLDFAAVGAGERRDASQLWQSLLAERERAGISSLSNDILRRAALSAYCYGEKSLGGVMLSFAGDCTFAYFNETDGEKYFPTIYRNAGSVTYPLDLTRNVFGADDISVVNLEGALTTSKEHKNKQFYFRGEPSYVDILTGSSIEAVSVENNHSFDYLDKGFKETVSILNNAGVRYTCYDSPAAINRSGYRVVLISASMVSTTYKPEFQQRLEKYIKQYKGDKTLIVANLHWGTESADTPDAWQVQAAHSLIDAGADLIIGHHPHVLQGIEQYKGHYIVYSLGNFSFAGNAAANHPDTMIFRVSFTEAADGSMTAQRMSVVPCLTTSSGSTVNNYRPTVLFGESGQATVNKILSLSGKLDGGISSVEWSRIP